MTYREIRKLHKLLKKSRLVYIMGHKDMDLDAFGAAIGIADIAGFNKSFVIIDDEYYEPGVKRGIDILDHPLNIIKSLTIKDINVNEDVLVVVDANRIGILQDGLLVDKFKKVIVIDHHEKSSDTVTACLSIIDTNRSSASEIIVDYLDYYIPKITKSTATMLLSGITLDTRGFSVKTYGKTHYAAYFLTKYGADINQVNYLLKQGIDEYISRQKIVANVEVIGENIAFSAASNRIIYKREELAKVADTLLEFENIEFSVVIGKLASNIIGISARSLGNINAGYILKQLGGGGDRFNAAAKISDVSINDVVDNLKAILKEEIL